MKSIFKILIFGLFILLLGNDFFNIFSNSFVLCEEETVEDISKFESKEKAKGLALFGFSILIFMFYLKCIKTGTGCDFDPGSMKEIITSYFDTMANGERDELGYTVAEREEIIRKAEKEIYSSVEAFEKSIQNMDPELRKKWIYIKTN
jgi:hypothetical protein